MINLRPYQTDAIDELTEAATAGHRRLLLQAGCALGKTVIAAQIIRHCTSNGKKALFLAHRREIVLQTINKLDRFGVPSGMIMSGDEWDSSHLVNVASIQTLHAWAVRRRKINMPRADLVIVDETHALSGSSSWRDILNNYPEAIILGLTATPITQTGMGLG